jgi:Na+/H+-dicarboxylate symporter
MENNCEHRLMTVGDWMITLLVLSLPLVNIVMLLVWAFSSGGNANRRNYCRATLLWFVIVATLSIIAFVVLAAMGWAVQGLN